MPWRTIEGEDLAPATMLQLKVLLRGAFEKRRFPDLLDGATVTIYYESRLAKLELDEDEKQRVLL